MFVSLYKHTWFFTFLFVVCACAYHGTHVETRRQPAGVGSPPSSCETCFTLPAISHYLACESSTWMEVSGQLEVVPLVLQCGSQGLELRLLGLAERTFMPWAILLAYKWVVLIWNYFQDGCPPHTAKTSLSSQGLQIKCYTLAAMFAASKGFRWWSVYFLKRFH